MSELWASTGFKKEMKIAARLSSRFKNEMRIVAPATKIQNNLEIVKRRKYASIFIRAGAVIVSTRFRCYRARSSDVDRITKALE